MEYHNISKEQEELIVRFEIQYLVHILKPATIRCYRTRITHFLSWNVDEGGKPLAEISRKDIRSYQADCRRQGGNGKPDAAFRRFFDYLKIIKKIKINPMDSITMPGG